MNFDRSSIFPVVLCVLAYIGYEYHLNTKYPDRYKKPVSQEITEVPQSSRSETTLTSPSSTTQKTEKKQKTFAGKWLSDEELTIENDQATYVFDQRVGGIKSVTLKNYDNNTRSGRMTLLDHPLLLQGTALSKLQQIEAYHATRMGQSIRFSRTEGPWEISHTIMIDPKGYGAKLHFNWQNNSDTPQQLTSSVFMMEKVPYAKSSGGFLPGLPTGKPMFVKSVNNQVEWVDIESFCENSESNEDSSIQNSNLEFLGQDRHYFVNALLPQSSRARFTMEKFAHEPKKSCSILTKTFLEQGSVAPTESVSFQFKTWFGPKQSTLLESYDQILGNIIDYGFFSILAKPLLFILQLIQSLVVNWGIAIIICTILLKLLLYPLNKKAMVSMHKMKLLQPELTKLRERFKDDPQKQNLEVMNFVKKHKFNPLGGCFPLFLQMPVFIAFCRVLPTSIELRQAPFFGWIQDLSVMDPYYITPVLLGVTMFLQQRKTPAQDPNQQKIMMIMPIMIPFMMITFPAGMMIYMLTNTIISIFQQEWITSKLNKASSPA